MKLKKQESKKLFSDWIKTKNQDAKTILAIHIITIVSVFVAALIIQPFN